MIKKKHHIWLQALSPADTVVVDAERKKAFTGNNKSNTI